MTTPTAPSDRHTPGPWTVEPELSDTGLHLIEAHHEYGLHTLVARTCFAPASEANARLIAAAPCLLEALKNLLFASENADETGYVTDVGFLDLEAIQEARAAIAKAQPEATNPEHKEAQ